MHIDPHRRRRALRVHYLRQRHMTLRDIGEQLGISHSTVRDDLKFVDTHWSLLAAAAADDLLLESMQLLKIRLSLAMQGDELAANANRLTPVEYLNAREAQETRLTNLAREIRRTVADVHRRAEQRQDQPELYEEEPQTPAETTPKSSKTLQPEETISSPEQEIVEIPAPQEKIPAATHPVPVSHGNPLPLPDHEALINEVIDLFPHLKGQSEEQILQFLDQFTDPKEEPTQLQPAAAG